MTKNELRHDWRSWLSGLTLVIILTLVGCDGGGIASVEAKESPAQHEEQHLHNSNEVGAKFEEGKGILLGKESADAIGLEFVTVEKAPLSSSIPITAQVYRLASEETDPRSGEEKGYAYAAAVFAANSPEPIVEGEKVEFRTDYEGAILFEGTIWKVNTALVPLLNKVELLIKIPDPLGSLSIGSFLKGSILRKDGQNALIIPKAAILETASGHFVYAKKGDYLDRIPIQVGATDGKVVQVMEGLKDGDGIVAKAVENLYMIELRAKDGSNAH